MTPATVLVTAGMLLAAGCGGTLEGKYRRGQLTTTTTNRGGATNAPPAPGATSSTTTTVPTAGNAAGQRRG